MLWGFFYCFFAVSAQFIDTSSFNIFLISCLNERGNRVMSFYNTFVFSALASQNACWESALCTLHVKKVSVKYVLATECCLGISVIP